MIRRNSIGGSQLRTENLVAEERLYFRGDRPRRFVVQIALRSRIIRVVVPARSNRSAYATECDEVAGNGVLRVCIGRADLLRREGTRELFIASIVYVEEYAVSANAADPQVRSWRKADIALPIQNIAIGLRTIADFVL